MQLELSHIIVIVIVYFFTTTWLVRKFLKAKPAFYLLSMWEIKRFAGFIRKQKRFHSFTTLFSELGLVLGFGVFASDFLYGKKRSKASRILIAVVTVIVLFLVYNFTIFRGFEIAPVIRPYAPFVAVVFSFFGVSGFMLLLLALNAVHILSKLLIGQPSCPGVAPVLPGIQIPQMPFIIPWYAWIGIIIAMVVHETSHGIQALGEKLKMKSAGILFFGILPCGAFVEPDERELRKAHEIKRLRVYSAGPSSNLLSLIPLALIVFLFSSFVLFPVENAYTEIYLQGIDHVEISGVGETLNYCGNPPAPAYGKLEVGMRLVEIQGIEIKSSYDVIKAKMSNLFKPTTFVVERDGERETIELVPHQETGGFGFTATDVMKPGFVMPEKEANAYFFTSIAAGILAWAFIISFLLGIANFLQVPIFDGGQIALVLYPPLLKPFIKSKKKRQKIVLSFFFIVLLILLLVNALPIFL